jgi:hypothetical protein
MPKKNLSTLSLAELKLTPEYKALPAGINKSKLRKDELINLMSRNPKNTTPKRTTPKKSNQLTLSTFLKKTNAKPTSKKSTLSAVSKKTKKVTTPKPRKSSPKQNSKPASKGNNSKTTPVQKVSTKNTQSSISEPDTVTLEQGTLVYRGTEGPQDYGPESDPIKRYDSKINYHPEADYGKNWFSLDKDTAMGYATGDMRNLPKRGNFMTYKLKRPLKLLKITPKSLKWLWNTISKKYKDNKEKLEEAQSNLRVSFGIRGGRGLSLWNQFFQEEGAVDNGDYDIKRHSMANSDYGVGENICSLGLDGYYADPLRRLKPTKDKNGIHKYFHPEIMLCFSGDNDEHQRLEFVSRELVASENVPKIQELI